MEQHIFIVEDEAVIRELYTYTLQGAGYACTCFETGDALFAELCHQRPDLLILDIMLDGSDGFEILQRVKSDRRYADIPVIMVSAKGEELSKVKGLNLGADDYIAKPFGVLELVARVRVHLRRNARAAQHHIAYKDIAIDDARHQVSINNTDTVLTLKEYNLLKLLCQNANVVLNREDIFTLVWGSDFIGETRTLDMHIMELRKRLNECGSGAEIQTIRGVGYTLR